jgi:hypothetical protein
MSWLNKKSKSKAWLKPTWKCHRNWERPAPHLDAHDHSTCYLRCTPCSARKGGGRQKASTCRQNDLKTYITKCREALQA